MLGQLVSEIGVILQVLLDFCMLSFSFISIVFIKIHEYTNKILFISYHKVRVECLTIMLISSFNNLG